MRFSDRSINTKSKPKAYLSDFQLKAEIYQCPIMNICSIMDKKELPAEQDCQPGASIITFRMNTKILLIFNLQGKKKLIQTALMQLKKLLHKPNINKTKQNNCT